MDGGTGSIGLEKCTLPPNQQTTAPIPTHQRRCARGAAVPARFCDRSEALVPANTPPTTLVCCRLGKYSAAIVGLTA